MTKKQGNKEYVLVLLEIFNREMMLVEKEIKEMQLNSTYLHPQTFLGQKESHGCLRDRLRIGIDSPL